jgi:hypothetical protein
MTERFLGREAAAQELPTDGDLDVDDHEDQPEDQPDGANGGARVNEPDGCLHRPCRPRHTEAKTHPHSVADQVGGLRQAGAALAVPSAGHQHSEDLLAVLPPELRRIPGE